MPDDAPRWLAWSAPVIRALPFGRYRIGNAVAGLARTPFTARLPADLGAAAFECDLRDSIAREVCFTGRYEPQETTLALALLRPGMTVLDVGANWGYFTLVAVRLIGAAGAVFGLVLLGRAIDLPTRLLGVAIVLSALAMMALVPRSLAARWRTPPE